MKRSLVGAAIAAMICSAVAAQAEYKVTFDFETSWDGYYARGWANARFGYGNSVAQMMRVTGGQGGSGHAMKLIADWTDGFPLMAGVNWVGIDSGATAKQYDPYFSAWYYDEGWETNSTLHAAGQLFAIPSGVNPYLPGGGDYTDIQFGAIAYTSSAPPKDQYRFLVSGQNEPSPRWQDTQVFRHPGWVNLKMQLSSADGYVHFYVNGDEVGTSYRNDYVDIGDVGLYTNFNSGWSGSGDKPYTIWDNIEFGSSAPIPEPVFFQFGAMMGLGGLGIFRLRRRA